MKKNTPKKLNEIFFLSKELYHFNKQYKKISYRKKNSLKICLRLYGQTTLLMHFSFELDFLFYNNLFNIATSLTHTHTQTHLSNTHEHRKTPVNYLP